MLKILDRIIHELSKFEIFVSALSLTIIVVINSANLLSRWIFKFSFDWILEISLILFVYAVMFVVPVLHKEKGFIQMHLIEEHLTYRANAVLRAFVEMSILLFFIYLLPYAFKLSAGQINVQSRGLGIPRIYVTIPIFISALLCVPTCISNLIYAYKDFKE